MTTISFHPTTNQNETDSPLMVTLVTAGKPGHIRFIEAPGKPLAAQVSIPETVMRTSESLRKAGGALVRQLISLETQAARLDLTALPSASERQAFLQGILLGGFDFDAYKSDKNPVDALALSLYHPDSAALKEDIEHTQQVCAAQNLARSWAHEPPNIINPVTLAERAAKFAEDLGLEITVLDDASLSELGAHSLVAVGKASQTPSRLIILKYKGTEQAPPAVIIGKAITFDTGGYSLKTNAGMQTMKYDKSGAMTVFGVMQAVAQLKVKTPVIGVVAAAENMIAGNAYRPSDIVHTLSGKTVEIVSTDAEGRMVLADALTYACEKLSPRFIVDLATLTGGVIVSLGKVRAGVMGNDQKLLDDLMAAGETSGERLWPFPLDDEYLDLIKGHDSDLRNSAGKPQASAIVGGVFLKQFITTEVPWAHIDIAGMSDVEAGHPYFTQGGTGFGVRLLVEFLQSL